jgi:hypothetical protein
VDQSNLTLQGDIAMGRFVIQAVLAVLVAAVPVQAGILLNQISYDGIPDEFKDNSRGQFVDRGGPGISPLDIIYGVLKVTDKVKPVAEAGGLPSMVGVIYSLENSVPLAANILDVVAPAAADPFSLLNLGNTIAAKYGMGGYIQDTDWTTLITAYPLAQVAIISKVGGTDLTLTNDQMIAYLLQDDGVVGTIGGGDGGGWGIELLAGRSAANDFFQIKLTGSPISAPSGTPIGDELAGLSVLYSSNGANWGLVPSIDEFNVLNANEMFLTANVQSFGNSAIDPFSWDTQDNTNFALNGLPEPSALVVWAIGLGLVVPAVRLYRRKRA